MTDEEQIQVAKAIAHIAHRGQTDKAGNPYIGHPARVAERVSMYGPLAISTAWLHDVLEDTDITKDDLRAAGVDYRVINFVELLTGSDGQKPEDYYDGIKGTARTVKLADIADNTSPDRLALLDDATIVRLTRKYAKARKLLGATDD